MKKRIVSMELLRILAMMMVVMLHYLSKGELLTSLTEDFDTGSYIAWLLESFSIVAVNVYMLISGYFLVESGFKMRRLAELICQVLFYSLLIPPILMAVGVLRGDGQSAPITVYRLLQYIFPSLMGHYWFITAYLVMYLLLPVLAAGAKALSRTQLRNTILLLLLFFSVSKSVGENGTYGYFCERDAATVVVRDSHRLKKMVQEQYPGVPYVILGHSMGSFILRNYLCRYGTGIQAAIIVGTGMQPKVLIMAGKAVAAVQKVFTGSKHPSNLLNALFFGTFNKRIPDEKTQMDWLTKQDKEGNQ